MELETVGCGSVNSPLHFDKMQSSHELPTLSSTSTMQSLIPKMHSSHELPTPNVQSSTELTVFSEDVEFV